MEKNLKNISKLLSLVLRHQPEFIGVTINENGWTDVDKLIQKLNEKGISADIQIIETIVAENDKKRFVFNNDKSMIRASQGHSIDVDVELEQAVPPPVLYHGTAINNVPLILQKGLQKQSRQYVHLSDNIETAKIVGSRHGLPIVLEIDAAVMCKDGFIFYQSANKVWLTDNVPARFLKECIR
ncbi:MAG TPA: RNA 2'-phosphotransferase [Parafilimonas sp.]|nr:RNA 2'-phosphotransferase [Parafilimonas sp.]